MHAFHYHCKVLLCIVFLHRDGNFLDLVDSEVGGRAERSDDGLGMEPLLHVRLELLQELGCQEGDRGRAISNLRRFENTGGNKRISQGKSFTLISYCHHQRKTERAITSASWDRAISTRVLAAG